MELNDFNRHAHYDREALVWEYGQLMITRQQENYYKALYNMGGYFAEVWYSTESNEVELVRGFNDMSGLKPYLDSMNLSELSEWLFMWIWTKYLL